MKELTAEAIPLHKPNSRNLKDHEVAKLYSSANAQPVENLSWNSQYTVLWECPNGEPHQFKRQVCKMTASKLCPYCTGKRLLVGFNDLATTDPLLSRQWSLENGLSPAAVMRSSTEKVLWEGLCGHRWTSSPRQRTYQGQKCPYCAGIKALAGFNDFAVKHPELVKFWHPNNTLGPDELTEKSNKTALWLCRNGHESSMSPKSWLYSGCKICSGRKLLVGFNDVFSKAPHLKDEWDLERNTLDPLTLRFNERNYSAHWLCKKCGVRWRAIVRARVKGSGCHGCAVGESKLELKVVKAISEEYRGPLERRRRMLKRPGNNPLEVDIWLPELKLGFEVQDFSTHSRTSEEEPMIYRNRRIHNKPFKKGPSYHEAKSLMLLNQHGGKLLEIWEDVILKPEDHLRKVLKKALDERIEELVL